MHIKLLKRLVLTGLCLAVFADRTVAQNALKGRVMSKDGPLAGAIVFIPDTKWGKATDSIGKFELDEIANGSYDFTINYIGFNKKVVKVTLNNKGTVNLGDITLTEDSSNRKEVTVKGAYRKGSELDALQMTKASNKIVTVISAEGMQKLPDKNIAEAVQRVAGVKMERNKGEGSNISLRGTPGDWTATLINGDRLPTADEDNPSRTFEFEVFPSNLVDDIFVTRSITPDFEADNIGGAVNFHTVAPAEKKTLKINLGGGMNLIASKPLYDFNFIYGNISKNKKLSWSIGGSEYDRAYGADAMQILYGTNFSHSINKFQLKDYFGNRRTTGVNGALQYKFNDNFKIGVHFMHGRMDDDKYQYRKDYNYSDGSGSRIRLLGTHGLLQRRLYGGDVTGEWKVNKAFTVDARVAAYLNTFEYGPFPYAKGDPRNGYVSYDFISPLLEFKDMVTTDFNGHIPDSGSSSSNSNVGPNKFIGKDDPYGTGDSYKNIHPKPTVDAKLSDYSFNHAWSEINHTKEKDPLVVGLNGTYQLNEKIKIKGGLKFRYKEGSREISYFEWLQNTADPKIPTDKIYITRFNLQDAPRNSSFLSELGGAYKNQFFPFLTPDQMGSFFNRLGDTLFTRAMDKYNQDFKYWVGGKYNYNETMTAGYLMAEATLNDKWKLVGGLRIENTHLHQVADTTDTVASQLVTPSSITEYYEPLRRSIDRSYIQFLPSLNADYTINDNSELRLAASRTMHRPNFEETKPGAGVIKYENLEITFGKPNLKPTISYNLDATYQLYIGKRDMITIGGYYKYVQDHIFTKISADTDPLTGIFIKKYANAGVSYILGFEASIDKHFDFLKGFWKGFGASANITYSYSEMHVPGRSFKQAMTEQTPLIYNVSLYYEKGRVNTKLALNYTGPYLLGLNLAAVQASGSTSQDLLHKDTDYDLFRGETYSLDYQLSVKINSRFSAYAEANNLLDAQYKLYIGQPWRPKRIEYYKQRFQIGVKFQL